MTNEPPLLEDVVAPAEEGAGLLRDTLRKSFPVESGASIPSKVVHLMLELSHVERPPEMLEQEKAPSRRRKRRAPLKAAAIGIGVAAAMLRRRQHGRRRTEGR